MYQPLIVAAVLFLTTSNVIAAGAFIEPVTGWKLYKDANYDTFKEDQNHPCSSNQKNEKQCYAGPPYPAVRGCGYNEQCSALSNGNRHAAWDYDNPTHPGKEEHWIDGDQYMQYGEGKIYHAGHDDVKASNDGIVSMIVYNGKEDHKFGNTIVIKHPNLVGCDEKKCPGKMIYTQYSHLNSKCGKNTFPHGLKVGDPVTRGAFIGCIGGTMSGGVNPSEKWLKSEPGDGTKPNVWIDHLHFEFKTWGEKSIIGKSCGFSGSIPFGYPSVDPKHPERNLANIEDSCGYRNPADFIGKVFVDTQPVSSETTSPFLCVIGDAICWSPPDKSCVDSQLLIYKGVKYYNDGTLRMSDACDKAYKDAVSEGLSERYWRDVFLGHNDISSIETCRQ